MAATDDLKGKFCARYPRLPTTTGRPNPSTLAHKIETEVEHDGVPFATTYCGKELAVRLDDDFLAEAFDDDPRCRVCDRSAA